MKKRLKLIVLISFLGGLVGCGGGSSGGSGDTCDAAHLTLCTAEDSCVDVGGNWYENSCHSDPSSNWDQMKWDSGQWK